MRRPSLTGVFIGVGVLGLAATLVLGAMMWLEQRRADAVTEATRAGEDYLVQMRAYWPEAVEQVNEATQAGDMVQLTATIEAVVTDAPTLPEASDHAWDNAFSYRTALELRSETVGALEDLDEHLAEAQRAERFVGLAREASASPQDLLAGESGLDAATIRRAVVDVIEGAASDAAALDLGQIAGEDDYTTASDEVREALAAMAEKAVRQGTEMADRVESGGAVGTFDYAEERTRAVQAVDAFETAYRSMVGSALGPVLDASRAEE